MTVIVLNQLSSSSDAITFHTQAKYKYDSSHFGLQRASAGGY